MPETEILIHQSFLTQSADIREGPFPAFGDIFVAERDGVIVKQGHLKIIGLILILSTWIISNLFTDAIV